MKIGFTGFHNLMIQNKLKHFPTGSANRSQCIGLCDGFKFLSRYCGCGSWWLAQLVIDVKQPYIYAKERIAKTMHTLSSIGVEMWMRVCVCVWWVRADFISSLWFTWSWMWMTLMNCEHNLVVKVFGPISDHDFKTFMTHLPSSST